jgi:hypothetical protein
MRKSSEEIRRKRILAGLPGFIIGLLAGGLVSYWLNGTYLSRLTFAGCLAGIVVALAIFEKLFALPSENDFHTATWEEAAGPLGITSRERLADRKGEGKAEEKSDKL